MSKSGLFAHFGSKEELQLATGERAGDLVPARCLCPGFERPVPTVSRPAGLRRCAPRDSRAPGESPALEVQVVEVVRVTRAEDGEAERQSGRGDGYDFCDRRDVSGADKWQDKREPELPELECQERLASVGSLRLRPSREEQTRRGTGWRPWAKSALRPRLC